MHDNLLLLFFITSSVLDLTIVGLDAVDGDSVSQNQQPHYIKTCSNPSLDLGCVVYLLGHTEKKELTIGEAKVVIATDNLIKLSTDGITWSPGSAGFDVQGNLAFMVCDPMKLASSPTAKSSSTSTSSSPSSWKKDHPMQFGIPIPIICDWLNQHWEGSLDDLNKPKLPLIRLMSSGQKSDHSCASFTLRQVFKPTEAENGETPSSSNIISKPRIQPGPSCSASGNICQEEIFVSHEQGIPTPEIYESPRLTSVPFHRKENSNSHIQLLDINFPPRSVPKSIVLPVPIKRLVPSSNEKLLAPLNNNPPRQEQDALGQLCPATDADIISTGSVNGDRSEVQSSSSPIHVSHFPYEMEGFRGDYSSDGETTMYSAETMESRNYTSPREGQFQQVGRSQSCVNFNRRTSSAERNPLTRNSSVEKQQSFIPGRKTYSHGASSQRSHDFHSPTVSSIIKRRNNKEPIIRPRQNTVQTSPRWNF
ncbi:hypothetical protein MKW94_020224 [Papaver nudicaule]|uniref:Uncharacterized protein n=1 Tax=Papaver nudicaule TaxID=74823 RepID=A0AA41VQR3_PAPNU|nr:hypothetical protein [Papaver nudicaule]